MPERFEIYIVYKWRYINTLPFFPFLSLLEQLEEDLSLNQLALIHLAKTAGKWK